MTNLTITELLSLPPTLTFTSLSRQHYFPDDSGGVSCYGWKYSCHASLSTPPEYIASNGSTYRLSHLLCFGTAATIEEAKALAIAMLPTLVASAAQEIERRLSRTAKPTLDFNIDIADLSI